ncbi:indolepyruvate ferredoxin oxidoreductase subunit alpha [Maridesulfovibrio hydrothermalis]|uniref:Indolepyruvate oxidoreductase subunit IorA n=1 Tax=Maridesulfovibrio hydrothermalis AM13 = DSM 14728 TaxID=1121451 RepID=L0R920_9BACT|nr:indolepyruvate ferredoxin oxidoreductase subunit alpha [Maridesulfovibrio hydrothermalis]CCO22076.1 Indolepyruvate oxidoreductase subunit iorA [Maridesulfovibrio hydrothermalis AM13 = DSM 14728]
MAHPLLADNPGMKKLLLGNEAIVRGAIEAGVQMVTCYPGTPSSEVPDTFFRLSPEGDFTFEYSVNEKVALEVGGGAAVSGAMTLTTMKHVGVNVAADPLMTLAYVGTPGGMVLLSADDPGCHSSQNEQDNRYYARLAGMPCMEPATAQEAKDMTRDALNMSRETSAPFLLRTTTRVNHLRGPVEYGEIVKLPPVAGFKKNPAQFVPIPAFARRMHVDLLAKLEELREMAEKSEYNKISGNGKIGIVASGICRAYLIDALADSGLTDKFKVLELGFTFPMPTKMVTDFITSVDKVIILEELEPFIENEIRVLAQKNSITVEVIGKDNKHLPLNGEYSTLNVTAVIREALGLEAEAVNCCEAEEGLPMRPPNLCAGCTHRAAYYAVKKVFGPDAICSSDIGCYTLGILPPLNAADFLFCMGSSISAGSGASKASGQTVIGFIGDSTFFHSGITGLINAVFNQHNILLVILDNSTTAMTGHQPHPGVETTMLGANPAQVDIESIVKGCGVSEIRTVSPLNLKATTKALEELKAISGVRVLIAKDPCPLFARRTLGKKPGRTAYVENQTEDVVRVMEELACPAFEKTEEGIRVNEILCSGCMLCLQLTKDIKARKRSS